MAIITVVYTSIGIPIMAMRALHSKFIRLYTGKDERLAGNATRCYMAVYGITNQRSAQVAASRLLKNPKIAVILKRADARALEELTINAGYVLDKSVRLLDIAMGDEPVETVSVNTDPDTGLECVTVHETRSYDPATARAALKLIGEHKDIQAFQINVEHSHTHRLELRLAARSKLIEQRALSVDTLPALAPGTKEEEKGTGIIGGTPEIEIERENPVLTEPRATADIYIPQSTSAPESPGPESPTPKRRGKGKNTGYKYRGKKNLVRTYSGAPTVEAKEEQETHG